jgi:TonB-dependent SusC/RagA subfamily outer membrane receptor
LNGATISLKNGSASSMTKADGSFEITIPAGKITLMVSFVGYQSLDINVAAGESNISVSLKSAGDMSEVVVIGYGTKKKVDLTGAISTISAKEIESRPIANTQQALQGLIPNLNISVSNSGGEPGGSMQMGIRGLSSFSGSTAPFVLVDNIPMDINSINPADIETLTVLKDAASSAIYGARAAYGVILITTKSGKSSKERMNVSFQTNVAGTRPVQYPRFQ